MNITKIEISIYLMDVEILFSSSPFALLPGANESREPDNLGKFANVKPSITKAIDLDEETAGSYTFSLQDLFPDLATASAMILVSGGGIQRTLAHVGGGLKVQTMEKLGILAVATFSEGTPVPGAYVKVYTRNKSSNDVSFHKDGYTDRRGKFDYATLSSHGVESVEKFAILVSTKEHGLITTCAKPPAH